MHHCFHRIVALHCQRIVDDERHAFDARVHVACDCADAVGDRMRELI
jgi:hypothetical protein